MAYGYNPEYVWSPGETGVPGAVAGLPAGRKSGS